MRNVLERQVRVDDSMIVIQQLDDIPPHFLRPNSLLRLTPGCVSREPFGANKAAGTAANKATACIGILTATGALYMLLAATAPDLATALAYPCPVALNSVGYATAFRIHDIAPIGAAGIRPNNIIPTKPHRVVFSVSLKGVNNSGIDISAHKPATHRGLTLDRNAASATKLPTTSPELTTKIAG